MEVPGIPPNPAVQAPTEPEQSSAGGQNTAQVSQGAPAQEHEGIDRVDLVRAQNLASPSLKDMDLKKAMILLRQVTQQLRTMERQDLRQMYQAEQLRDLCCRLQNGVGV